MIMSEKPILFNAKMVQAILDGRKSCTRRLVRFLPGKNPNWTGYIKDENMLYNGSNKPCIKEAPISAGDILYVRETVWQKVSPTLSVSGESGIHWIPSYKYVASGEEPEENEIGKWIKRPSIHMPKEAARIRLKVTDVRIERLQNMTEEDYIKEGISPSYCKDCNAPFGCDCCPDEGYNEVDAFAELWDSTIKKTELDKYGFDADPWVWVIEFEGCEKPEFS